MNVVDKTQLATISRRTARVTVWFDADCPLCVREIALMQRLDNRGAVEFVDIQSSDHCPLDRAMLLERFHARDRNGALVSGAAAFAAMWREIPLLKPLGVAAKWPPFLTLMEFTYRGFLRIRPWLQRLVQRLELS